MLLALFFVPLPIGRVPRGHFRAINLAIKVGAFASRRLHSLDEIGSGTIVVDKRCAYFEAPWWPICIACWWEAIRASVVSERFALLCRMTTNPQWNQLRWQKSPPIADDIVRTQNTPDFSSSPREPSCGAFHFFSIAFCAKKRQTGWPNQKTAATAGRCGLRLRAITSN